MPRPGASATLERWDSGPATIRWGLSSDQPGTDDSSWLRQDPRSTLSNVSWTTRFPVWLVGTGTSPFLILPAVTVAIVTSNRAFAAWGCLPTRRGLLVLHWILAGTCRSPRPSSCPVCSGAASCLGLPGFSVPFPHFRESSRPCLGSPLPCGLGTGRSRKGRL